MKLVPGAPRHLRFSNYAAKKALPFIIHILSKRGWGQEKSQTAQMQMRLEVQDRFYSSQFFRVVS